MEVKIKKLHPNAVIPRYAKNSDAGLDLTAISANIEENGFYTEYGTGLSIEIPEGYVGLLYPRSSISNTKMVLSNSVGVIDSGYRGEIKLRFIDTELEYENDQYFGGEHCYEPGDRIGQLIILPYPKIEFIEVDELSETDRGQGGFGSSGK